VPTYTFDATRSYEAAQGSIDDQKFNPYFPADITTQKEGMDLGGQLPFGFSYDFGGFVSKSQVLTDFRTDPQDAADFAGGIRSSNDLAAADGLQMRQHLLKDFWIDADREQILARRLDLKVSQATLRLQVMQTLLAVELAYYDLIGAREKIRVQEQAVELRRQFVSETQRRIEVGESPVLDSAQAQTQLQNALTALTVAREGYSISQNRLIGLLTDDFRAWVGVDLQPADALEAPPPKLNRSDSFQSALATRPDLLEARLQVQKCGAMVKFRFNQLFPSLDLVGGYGGLGANSDSSSTMSDAISFRNPEYTYGVVLSFPLYNLSGQNDYRASKAAKKIAELQLQEAEQAVLLEVADCVCHVESCFSQVASTHQAAAYAEQALSAENEKLVNGFTTTFVVLEFQEILTGARTAEIQAKTDYEKSLAQLAFADGTIMQRHHLDLVIK